MILVALSPNQDCMLSLFWQVANYAYHHWHPVILGCLAISISLPLLLERPRWIPWLVGVLVVIWGIGMAVKDYRHEWRVQRRLAAKQEHLWRADSLRMAVPDTGFDLAGFLPEATRWVGEIHHDPGVTLSCLPEVKVDQGGVRFTYYFEAGPGRRIMGFHLLHYTSKDPVWVEKQFQHLLDKALIQHSEGWGDAGSDYVWKSDHDLYWLFHGPHYAHFNHIAIRNLVLAHSSSPPPTDSLVCRTFNGGCKSNREVWEEL